jgi:hypothetical protein
MITAKVPIIQACLLSDKKAIPYESNNAAAKNQIDPRSFEIDEDKAFTSISPNPLTNPSKWIKEWSKTNIKKRALISYGKCFTR